jgi:hypothetical protein
MRTRTSNADVTVCVEFYETGLNPARAGAP